MNEYTILHRQPKQDWQNVPVLRMEENLFPREHNVTAQAQLLYDEQALYLRLEATEQEIRAQHTGLTDEVCEDSCLEFFFCPMENDDRYFNLEINPNGAMFLGFGRCLQDLFRLLPESPPIRPQVQRTEDGWVLEYAIPHTFVQLFFPEFVPAPGKTIRANCYKCGDLTAHPHWLCWNPVPEEVGTFHCPAHFGRMRFA